MEHNNFPVRLLSGMAIATSLLISACNNHDTNETPVTTTESSSVVTSDTPKMEAPMSDSGAMAPSTTDPNAMTGTGMAKPNTAKKGLKGKASVTMPAATKMKTDATPDASGAYTNVDYIPSFPGGNAGLQKYFDSNLEYPSTAVDQGVEGLVKIGFTIDESGKLMNPAVEGERQGYGLDDEALRVVKKMPSWNPGKINGKPVKTKFTLPVRFALSE